MIGPADRPRGLVGGAFFCPRVVGPSDSVVQDVLRGDRDSADGFREMAELFVAHIEIESVVKEGDHHVRAAFFVDEAAIGAAANVAAAAVGLDLPLASFGTSLATPNSS